MTDYTDLIAQLKVRLDSFGDGRDLTSDNAKAVWYADRVMVQSIISGLMNIDSDLAKPERQLAEKIAERDAYLAKRTELEEELAVVVTSFVDSRARDNEHDRRYRCEQQLRLLDRGELLYAPGQAYPRLADLDVRISELTEKIARLKAKHHAYKLQAEAVLGATVTN